MCIYFLAPSVHIYVHIQRVPKICMHILHRQHLLKCVYIFLAPSVYIHIYRTFLLKKLTVSQLVMKFPGFYTTRQLITAFSTASLLSTSWVTAIRSTSLPYVFIKIHFNIILLASPRSSMWSPSFRSLHQNPVRNSPPFVPHAPPISYLIWSSQQYFVRSAYHVCVCVLQLPLQAEHLPRRPSSNTLCLCSALSWLEQDLRPYETTRKITVTKLNFCFCAA